MLKNLLSAAVIAATASISAPAMAMSSASHPSCDIMLSRMATALEAAVKLNNSDFPMVNWVRNKLAPFFDSERYALLNNLAFDNLNVKMAGGGENGYFRGSEFIDQDDPPYLIRNSYNTMYNWFQINISHGASCNLNDW